jgi:hypothetical protein
MGVLTSAFVQVKRPIVIVCVGNVAMRCVKLCDGGGLEHECS